MFEISLSGASAKGKFRQPRSLRTVNNQKKNVFARFFYIFEKIIV